MLLSVENLHVYYGAIHAVKDVSRYFEAQKRQDPVYGPFSCRRCAQ